MLEPAFAEQFDHGFDSMDVTLLAALSEPAPRPVLAPEPVDLEMPGWIWGTMFACYGTFFGGLVAATGHDAEAVFMLVISIGYAVMYFGTAAALFGVDPPKAPSLFARGLAPLQTWTGPMNTRAVAAQVLAVPAFLAAFGLAAAVIRAVIIA